MRYLVILLLSMICASHGYAHSPYLTELGSYTDKQSGQKMRFVNWSGDGIIFADPVSVLLMDQSQGVYAQTPIGQYAGVLCFTAGNCIVYVYHQPLFPILYTPAEHLKRLREYQPDYPESASIERKGFDKNYAYYLLPMIFLQDAAAHWELISNFMVALFILLVGAWLMKRLYKRHRGFRKKAAVLGAAVIIMALAMWAGQLLFFSVFFAPILAPVIALCALCYLANKCLMYMRRRCHA